MSSSGASVRTSPHRAAAAPTATALNADADKEHVTGLVYMPERASSGVKARKAAQSMPKRDTVEWQGVKVIDKEFSNTPQVKCLFCGKLFCGGSTRVREHFLGTGKIDCCPCESEEFCEFKDKLEGKQEKADQKKRKAEAIAASDAAISDGVMQDKKEPKKRQRSIEASFAVGQGDELDNAIAELFYGDNIKHSIVNSPRFKRVIELAKVAPVSYKPPDRLRLSNDLLFSTTNRLRGVEDNLLTNLRNDCLTVVSDGWDDVERNHLINILICHSKAAFFRGTVKLTSWDHEDAANVASIISQGIEEAGKYTIIQVCAPRARSRM